MVFVSIAHLERLGKYSLLRRSGKAPVHSPNTSYQSSTDDQPWIRSHQPDTPTTLMQCSGRDTNDPYTQPSVKEGLIEISSFKRRHPSIFPGLTVENKVYGKESASKDTSTIKEALSDISRVRAQIRRGRLRISTTERMAGFRDR